MNMEINYIPDEEEQESVEVGDFIITTNGMEDFLYLIIKINSEEFNYGLLDLDSFDIHEQLVSFDQIKESNYLGDSEQIKYIVKSKKATLDIVLKR